MLNWSLYIFRSNVIPHSIDPVYRTGFTTRPALIQKSQRLQPSTRYATFAKTRRRSRPTLCSLVLSGGDDRRTSNEDGTVLNPTEAKYVKFTASGVTLDHNEDRTSRNAELDLYDGDVSSVVVRDGEGGPSCGNTNTQARGTCLIRQQVSARTTFASSLRRVPANPQAFTWLFFASFQKLPSTGRPNCRSFSNSATDDNVKMPLRVKATTAANRNLRVRCALLRSIEKEESHRRLRTKFIPRKVARPTDLGEERRVENDDLPVWNTISRWTSDFAKINTFRARQAQGIVSPGRRRRLPSLRRITLKHSLDSQTGQLSSINRWENMTRDEKLQLWHPALIHALQSDPLMALIILKDNLMNNGRLFPSYVVKDSLEHLACVYLQDVDSPAESSVDTLHRMSCFYLSTYGLLEGSASLSQRTVYLLSKYSDEGTFLSLVDCLQQNNAYTTTNSKLHLMARCAELGKIGIALSLLETIPVAELVGAGVQSFCVSLLRVDMEVDDLYGLRSNILAYMLKVGVRPNRQMANVIILNAMEAGDLNTAWRSHEIAKENGLFPDVFTYTCLLKGVQHGDGEPEISYIQECATIDGTLAKNCRLGFEILYAIYVAEESGPHWRPFLRLLPKYREFFDVQPLTDLGILDYRHYTKPMLNRPTPPAQALGLMILAWLHGNNDFAKAQEIYKAYLRHVREGHPVISPLAGTDHIANAFIKAFGSHAETLHLCTQIIQHMLKPDGEGPSTGPKNGRAVESEPLQLESSRISGGVVKIAPPTAQTWNILLHSFIRNRQAAAAEKVLTIMQRRGHEPNQVTWNTLLGGYASMQDAIGVVGSMKRLEKAGMAADKWTMEALSRVTDRAALLEAFERSSEGRSVHGPEDDRRESS